MKGPILINDVAVGVGALFWSEIEDGIEAKLVFSTYDRSAMLEAIWPKEVEPKTLAEVSDWGGLSPEEFQEEVLKQILETITMVGATELIDEWPAPRFSVTVLDGKDRVTFKDVVILTEGGGPTCPYFLEFTAQVY